MKKNSGLYLNPQSKTPDKGLYSAVVSVSLAKGLLMNKRIATLKQAKWYHKLAIEKQKIVLNNILFNAVEEYLSWLKNYQTEKVYIKYLKQLYDKIK